MPLRSLSSLLKVGSKWGPTPTAPLFLPRNIKEDRLFHKQGFLKLAGYVSTSLV